MIYSLKTEKNTVCYRNNASKRKQPQAMAHHLGRVVNNINVFFFLRVNCLIDLNNIRIHIIA